MDLLTQYSVRLAAKRLQTVFATKWKVSSHIFEPEGEVRTDIN